MLLGVTEIVEVVAPLLQCHESPPVTDKFADEPLHIDTLPETRVVTYGCTVTVMRSYLEHKPDCSLITMYVSVAVGVRVMVLVVSPVLQCLDVPPLTERVMDEPRQILVSCEAMVATVGIKDTLTLSVFEQ